MKKLLLLVPLLILGCSRGNDSEPCRQTWKVMEYCTITSNCPVGGCGTTPTTAERTFDCDEVEGVQPGQTVLYKTESSCAKFYRQYLERIK